jgi:signal transduction histidine kinase
VSETDHTPAAPVGVDLDLSEADERLVRIGLLSESARPGSRETAAELLVGSAFLVAAVAMAVLLPADRSFDLPLAATYALAYAITTRIQFDAGAGYTSPTQLVLVPMLFAMPARTVPLIVLAGLLLGDLPDYLTRSRHPARAVKVLGDSWYAVGPALVLSLGGDDDPAMSDWPLYVGALAAQIAVDFAASTTREWLGQGVPPPAQLSVLGWIYLVDILLSPVGLLAALASTEEHYNFLLVLPLAALFLVFARERRGRIENALRLGDAHRERADLNARLLESERAATRAREEVIAGASHEMQTPLAVLLGLLDVSARGELTSDRHAEVHAGMRRQAIRLRHLVSQFVDYTNLKTGRPLRIDPRAVSVDPILAEVAASQPEGVRIEIDLPERLGDVLVDPERLHQVLMNLVSNAVKFSPAGSPIRIAALQRGSSIEVSVIDRGAGIEPDELPRMFEEFRHGKRTEGDAGAGLGLYMVRMLTEPQGVQVRVESRPGEGSRFTVVLPRAAEGSAAP